MDKVILKAGELDDYLTSDDKDILKKAGLLYDRALKLFPDIKNGNTGAKNDLIAISGEMGVLMRETCKKNSRVHIYSMDSSSENHFEASRVISKLRDENTDNQEFVYYIQRSYEMLFRRAWDVHTSPKSHLFIKTPVSYPVQNYAVHKIADIENSICNTVMCVMLRAALLPSMIVSKEIEEYSSSGYITPFSLFKIYRNDEKKENDMEYIIDLEKSYVNYSSLDGKDWVFADPMNATGGSFVTVVKFLIDKGIKPRSVKILNVISALKGSLTAVRALENCNIYTLWMDGVLNKDSYIMPGLGDAGDRINGRDNESNPRNIIQLLADYGSGIANLYRSQYGEIEKSMTAAGK